MGCLFQSFECSQPKKKKAKCHVISGPPDLLFRYPPGNQHIPWKVHFEDDFPFPQVGYVNFLEGIPTSTYLILRIPQKGGCCFNPCLIIPIWLRMTSSNPFMSLGVVTLHTSSENAMEILFGDMAVFKDVGRFWNSYSSYGHCFWITTLWWCY